MKNDCHLLLTPEYICIWHTMLSVMLSGGMTVIQLNQFLNNKAIFNEIPIFSYEADRQTINTQICAYGNYFLVNT